MLIMLNLPGLLSENDNGTLLFAELGQCHLDNEAPISDCTVAYRTFGSLNEAKDNAILIPTWYGATSADLIYLADAEYVDPDKYFVILVDALGNGASSSPSNSRTQGHRSFPRFGIGDMVTSQYRLVTEALGLKRLHAVFGFSMGGMQAFEWSVRYPGFASEIAPVVASPQLTAFDRNTWRMSNLLLEWWLECRCREAELARARWSFKAEVPTALDQRLTDDELTAAIEQRADAAQMSEGLAIDLIYRAEAMIDHDISKKFGGDMTLAAERTRAQWLVWVGADDRLVTPDLAIEFGLLVGATVIVADNDCGHIETICARVEFAQALRSFLAG
jgi:homoserine O-acetyltransferase/O-succinyltransferase